MASNQNGENKPMHSTGSILHSVKAMTYK